MDVSGSTEVACDSEWFAFIPRRLWRGPSTEAFSGGLSESQSSWRPHYPPPCDELATNSHHPFSAVTNQAQASRTENQEQTEAARGTARSSIVCGTIAFRRIYLVLCTANPVWDWDRREYCVIGFFYECGTVGSGFEEAYITASGYAYLPSSLFLQRPFTVALLNSLELHIHIYVNVNIDMESPTPSIDQRVLPFSLNLDFTFTLPIAEVRELRRIANLISRQLFIDRAFFDGLVCAVSTAYEGERAVVFATRVYECLIVREREAEAEANRDVRQNAYRGVAEEFREKLERAVCLGFHSFWDSVFKSKKFSPPNCRNTCIFIGGLAAAGIITHNQFKILATKLISNFRTRSVLAVFTEMMRWASASPNARFVKEPVFLMQCVAMTRTRCAMYIGDGRCMEEINATQLLEELLFRKGFAVVCQPQQQPSPPPSPLPASASETARATVPRVRPWEAPVSVSPTRHAHGPPAPARPNPRTALQVRQLDTARPIHHYQTPTDVRMRMHAVTMGTSTSTSTSTAPPIAMRNTYYRTPAWACSPPAEELNRTCPKHVLESVLG